MFQAFLRLLYPSSCISCGTKGAACCASCLGALPLPIETPRFALYPYSGITKQAITDLKYRRKSEVARALLEARKDDVSLWLSEKLQSLCTQELYFVPIPQHYTRSFTRGFNQSDFIIKALGFSPTRILKKIKSTERQATLSERARMKNLSGVFAANRTLDPHACYIIVDDVCTTGATVTEAMRALQANGARHIETIFFAAA
jgi:ComF family protein